MLSSHGLAGVVSIGTVSSSMGSEAAGAGAGSNLRAESQMYCHRRPFLLLRFLLPLPDLLLLQLRLLARRRGFNPDEQYAVILLIHHLPGLDQSGVMMKERFPSAPIYAQLMDRFTSSTSITPESYAANQTRLDAIPLYVRLHSLRRQGGGVGGEGYYT
jgi:hypothetical protein